MLWRMRLKHQIMIGLLIFLCIQIIFSNKLVLAKLNDNTLSEKITDSLSYEEEEIYNNRIHFLPVNGDAILLESQGKFALIDGGEDSDNPKGLEHLNLEGTEQYLIDYIKDIAGDEEGNVVLEFIVGTHAHSDHLGGLDTVVNDPQIKVKKAYLKKYNEERIIDYEVIEWDNMEVYLQLLDSLIKNGIEIIHDIPHDSFELGEMLIQFFNMENDIEIPIIKKGENENSLGIKVTVNGKSAFLAGDINNYDGDEDKIAPLIGNVDVLKLGHHGLIGSSTKNFFKYFIA